MTDAVPSRLKTDGAGGHGASTAYQPSPIRATPFVWREPALIPPRRWVYGHHYIRQFATATIAPGGLGKSSLLLVEAIAMVTERELLGHRIPEPLRVWYWNGEDPREELERRVAAIVKHYGIDPEELGDRLFLDSGRAMPVCIARHEYGGLQIVQPDIDAVMNTVQENGIDVIQIDPFIKTHQVSENDNAAIDRVITEWAHIAEACNCSVELSHHARKPMSGKDAETSVYDSRGASALLYGTRSARVLNRMTKDEGEKAEVENHRHYFRIENGKANLTAPPDTVTWCQIIGLDIANGDNVGVVVAWRWPDPFAGLSAADYDAIHALLSEGDWREDVRATKWAGKAIAEALDLDLADRGVKASVRGIIKTWLKNGALRVEARPDAKREMKGFLCIGKWPFGQPRLP